MSAAYSFVREQRRSWVLWPLLTSGLGTAFSLHKEEKGSLSHNQLNTVFFMGKASLTSLLPFKEKFLTLIILTISKKKSHRGILDIHICFPFLLGRVCFRHI